MTYEEHQKYGVEKLEQFGFGKEARAITRAYDRQVKLLAAQKAELTGAKRILAKHNCFLNAEGNWVYSCAVAQGGE